MTNIYPYKPETLGEMFALRSGDIQALIVSEGVPFYSLAQKQFIGFLPSLKSGFILNDKTAKLCASNVNPANYNISIQESLIRIASKNNLVPASSVLYNNLWKAEADNLLDIDKNFFLLISSREEVPVFCGHQKLITRLADNFAGDISVVNVLDFIKQW